MRIAGVGRFYDFFWLLLTRSFGLWKGGFPELPLTNQRKLPSYSRDSLLSSIKRCESPSFEELQILANDPEEDGGRSLPFSMIFDPNWKPEYLENEPLAGTIHEKVFLSSGNTNLGFHRIHVWINASTYFPEKIVTIDWRQTETSYEFSNLLVDQNHP